MSEKTIKNLVETRKRVVVDVNQERLSVSAGARILGMTRQGFWKLRRKVNEYSLESICGRKRGPKTYHRAYNRTARWIEETVERFFNLYGVDPDRMVWLLEDCGIIVSRATVYRILVRRRLITPKCKEKRKPVHLYTKGYPGEEVQVDTTQPLGKSGPTLITAVDDFSRFGMADAYFGNRSSQAADFLRRMVNSAPFPIKAVRVDNGSEFKKDFVKVCKELGITIIRNPVRHPTSNGKVERLHRTIEEECFWRVQAKPDDLDYACYWLSRYLGWYNTKRRHGGYGMKGRTPQQRIEDWIINNPSYLEGVDVNETLILYRIWPSVLFCGKIKYMSLPNFLQSSLASYDLTKMDAQRDKNLIITEVLNKGDDQDIDWLLKTYTAADIKRVIKNPMRGMWFKENLLYWQKILAVKAPKMKQELAYINLDPMANINLYKKFFKI